MMGWTVVIADDEAPAREELAYLLEQMEDVKLVVQAAGGMEAIRKVQEHSPDLLFLDMEMPDLNGMQAAQIVADMHPQVRVVFSTAYDQYAVDAFKLRAFHYMLKPYDEEDLRLIFRELRKERKSAEAGPSKAAAASGRARGKLALEVENGIKYVDPQDIKYIEKEGKYVQVHTGAEMYGVTTP